MLPTCSLCPPQNKRSLGTGNEGADGEGSSVEPESTCQGIYKPPGLFSEKGGYVFVSGKTDGPCSPSAPDLERFSVCLYSSI